MDSQDIQNLPINSLDDLYIITKQYIEGKNGSVMIHFADRHVPYKGNDVIGNCLQEWLPDWFQFIGVNLVPNPLTQQFPDFIATFNNIAYDVEIKCWNIINSPAFDLANFSSYVNTVFNDPRQLNANYFILGYRPLASAFAQGFTVERVYLKKIWEITGKSRNYPIGLQVKRGQPYAIRPCAFNRQNAIPFGSRLEFVQAIKETIDSFSADFDFSSDEWFDQVTFKYQQMYNEPI